MSDEAQPQSSMILYQTEDGTSRLDVRMQGETVWLSLNQMADLFQRDKSVISKHIKNVFEEGELREDHLEKGQLDLEAVLRLVRLIEDHHLRK